MIISKSTGIPYYTYFTNSKHEFFADAPPAKGGSDAGFRPHELLEASLACCLNIWLRMYADKNSIELPPSRNTRVNRPRPAGGSCVQLLNRLAWPHRPGDAGTAGQGC
jgi:organic hydroperoxide reductase OsmC/OhrA